MPWLKFILIVFLFLFPGCSIYENMQRKPMVPITYQRELPKSNHLGHKISSFATPIQNNDVIRTSNLFTAVRRLSGRQIQPGGVLSFREVMGGYRPGTNFQWGRWLTQSKPVGIPEGVEQVATTFYMAATSAGLEVREGELVRQNQPWAPKTGQILLTATRDLRVSNKFSYPVRIYGQVTGGSIIIGIYR